MHKQFRVQRRACCISQAFDINHYSRKKKMLFLLSNWVKWKTPSLSKYNGGEEEKKKKKRMTKWICLGCFRGAFSLVFSKHSYGYFYLACSEKATLNLFFTIIRPWKLMIQVAVCSPSWWKKIRWLKWQSSWHRWQILKATREKEIYYKCISYIEFEWNLTNRVCRYLARRKGWDGSDKLVTAIIPELLSPQVCPTGQSLEVSWTIARLKQTQTWVK